MRFKGTDDPQLDWCYQVIDRQASQLTRLVDDLLDVSRITRGKINLRHEDVELASIIRDAVDTSKPVVDAHRHDLRVEMPELPVLLHGDAARLTQIVANLLNNAAKYQNEQGRIDLRAHRDGNFVEIRVRDYGIGLTDEMRPLLFELFSQGERTLDRSQGGLGIGLSLVKKLVELHGGTVTATSDGPGTGSEFIVRLPCLPELPQARMTPAIGASALPPRTQRILVVDDSIDAAESMAILLRNDGHQVTVAHDGVTALRIAAAERPSTVLLDIGLPGLDGYEVCRRVRQLGLPDVRIVAMTGYGQEKDRQRAKAAGFDTHTVKPVQYDELRRLLTI
jgi:CheY-like chemotaxis protein/two-component sensor histidine kinase